MLPARRRKPDVVQNPLPAALNSEILDVDCGRGLHSRGGNYTLAPWPIARDIAAPSSSAPGRSGPPSPCCSARGGHAHDAADPHRRAGRAPRARSARTALPAGGRAAARAADRVGRGGARARRLVFLGVPSRGLDEVIAGLAGGGARPARRGRVAGQGPRPARRHRADRAAARALRRRAHRLHRRARARARDGDARAPGLVAASADEEPRGDAGADVHRAPASSASCPTTRSAWSWRARRRTPPRSRPAPRRPRASTPPAPPPGHIFAEVWRFAEAQGARPESLIGLAGTGDLVATALAPQSRNRRAGELLAAGRAGGRDPRSGSARPSSRWSRCRCSPAALAARGRRRAGDRRRSRG